MISDRISIVCHDLPYPPLHGGRRDMWNRMLGFRELGIAIQLFVPRDAETAGAKDQIERQIGEVMMFPLRTRLAALVRPRTPPRAARFLPHASAQRILFAAAEKFAPTWVLADGWTGFGLARGIARHTQRPLVYRSQNIEHEYWRSQATRAHGVDRLRLQLTANRMQRFERSIRETADLVLDISDTDHERFAQLNWREKSVVLPPTIPSDLLDAPEHGDSSIDVLFGGNMWTPNNVEGVLWFLDHVLPQLRARASKALRIVFAGASPSPRIVAACEAANVECVVNPSDLAALFPNARVLINPVLSGSGVNMKMIEMLASGRSIVTTGAGARGLPTELLPFVRVADDAISFAENIVRELTNPSANADQRADALNACFGLQRLSEIVALVRTVQPSLR